MPQREVKCTHCQNPVIVDDAWMGMEIECPHCKGIFLFSRPQPSPAFRPPPFPRPQPSPAFRPGPPGVSSLPQYSKASSAAASETEARSTVNVGKIIKISLLVLLLIAFGVGGIMIYIKCTEFTPEDIKGNEFYAVTKTRVNNNGAYGVVDIARMDFFPFATSQSNFFYRNVTFCGMSVRETGEKDLYEGTVSFKRNGKDKKMTRPVIVDRRGGFTHYRFPVRYDENPEHLEEDGDMIFDLADAIKPELAGWEYESGRASDGGTLVCTISKDGQQKELTLKVSVVTGDDKIDRIWIEFEEEE
jgi:phage FluMu protein Com